MPKEGRQADGLHAWAKMPPQLAVHAAHGGDTSKLQSHLGDRLGGRQEEDFPQLVQGVVVDLKEDVNRDDPCMCMSTGRSVLHHAAWEWTAV